MPKGNSQQSNVQPSSLAYGCVTKINVGGGAYLVPREKEETGVSMDCPEEQHVSAIGNRTQEQVPSASILEDWYMQHREDPYPTTEEKAQLAKASEKSTKQVCTWFSNRRTRNREGASSLGILVTLIHLC